jgi:hypothetical protein
MVEQVDRDLVMYFFEKYRPFEPTVRGNRIMIRNCDFCGNIPTRIVEVLALQHEKSLYVCFNCEALSLLIGKTTAQNLVYAAWASPEEGLAPIATDPILKRSQAAAVQHQKDFELPHVNKTGNLKELAGQAAAYRQAGFGKNWKIIPSLLSQYADRGTLSDKQRAVLVKFNNSCEAERKQPRRNH